MIVSTGEEERIATHPKSCALLFFIHLFIYLYLSIYICTYLHVNVFTHEYLLSTYSLPGATWSTFHTVSGNPLRGNDGASNFRATKNAEAIFLCMPNSIYAFYDNMMFKERPGFDLCISSAVILEGFVVGSTESGRSPLTGRGSVSIDKVGKHPGRLSGKWEVSMIDDRLLSLCLTLWRGCCEVRARWVLQAIHVSAKSVSVRCSMTERDAGKSDWSRCPEVCRQSSQLAWMPFTRTWECWGMGGR